MKNTLLWTSGVLTVLLALGLAIYLRNLDPGLLSLQLTYSQRGFEAVITQWSGADTARFRHHFRVDYLFIIAYGLFGWLLGSRLAAGMPRAPTLLRWLLPVAGCCDCVENLLQQQLLALRQFKLPVDLYLLAGIAATAKWLLVLAFVVLVVRWRMQRPLRSC